MAANVEFFQEKLNKLTLDEQEQHEVISQRNDCIAVKAVADCMVVVAHYRAMNGTVETRIGHFANSNLKRRSDSYQGFVSTLVQAQEVYSIKYATNGDYSGKMLQDVAEGLSKDTGGGISPEAIQAFKRSVYGPDTADIVYYPKSGQFHTLATANLAAQEHLADSDIKYQPVDLSEVQEEDACSCSCFDMFRK